MNQRVRFLLAPLMRKSVLINLECPKCNRTFDRIKWEVDRSKRLGRPSYCSLECAGSVNIRKNRLNETSNWHPGLSRRKDELSPFRRVLLNIKQRGWEYDLNLEDIKNQWEKQKGICPYTGFNLVLPKSSGDTLPKSVKNASLDRIDSLRGYVKGNVQFVSVAANLAKSDFSEEEFLEFCEAVACKHFTNLRNVV